MPSRIRSVLTDIYFDNYPRLYGSSVLPSREGMTGIGLFAADSYEPGQLVMQLNCKNTSDGQILSWDDLSQIHQDRVTAIAPGWYFCPGPDHPFWFLNHACHPNVTYRNWAKCENDSTIPLVASRMIRVGEELVIDYSTMTTNNDGEEENVPWTMQCLCGANDCRRVLTSFTNLPYVLQKRMLLVREPVSGIVPAFILNENRALVEELEQLAPELFEDFQSVLEEQFILAKHLGLVYGRRPEDINRTMLL
jgi:hypothetical protein